MYRKEKRTRASGLRRTTILTMASPRQKGRAKELKARDILTEAGYDVQVAPMPSKYSKQNDLWGLWDLVAVKHNEIRFVQVKSEMIYKAKLEPYEQFECPPCCTKELWVFVKYAREPIIKIL